VKLFIEGGTIKGGVAVNTRRWSGMNKEGSEEDKSRSGVVSVNMKRSGMNRERAARKTQSKGGYLRLRTRFARTLAGSPSGWPSYQVEYCLRVRQC